MDLKGISGIRNPIWFAAIVGILFFLLWILANFCLPLIGSPMGVILTCGSITQSIMHTAPLWILLESKSVLAFFFSALIIAYLCSLAYNFCRDKMEKAK